MSVLESCSDLSRQIFIQCSKQRQPNFLEGAKNGIIFWLTDPNWGLKLVARPFRITSEVKFNNVWHTHPIYPPFCFGRYFALVNVFEYFDPYLALYLELGAQIWPLGTYLTYPIVSAPKPKEFPYMDLKETATKWLPKYTKFELSQEVLRLFSWNLLGAFYLSS